MLICSDTFFFGKSKIILSAFLYILAFPAFSQVGNSQSVGNKANRLNQLLISKRELSCKANTGHFRKKFHIDTENGFTTRQLTAFSRTKFSLDLINKKFEIKKLNRNDDPNNSYWVDKVSVFLSSPSFKIENDSSALNEKLPTKVSLIKSCTAGYYDYIDLSLYPETLKKNKISGIIEHYLCSSPQGYSSIEVVCRFSND